MEWNNSALMCLEQCGERYRRRYLERESPPPRPRQVRGTVVHRVASASLMRKHDFGLLPTAEEAQDTAATEFTRAWKAGVLVAPDDLEEAGGSVKAVEARAKDFAVDLSGFHVEAVARAVNPVAVERKIVVKPKDSDLVIHGTIDLIDGTTQGEIIRDLKTSEKSPARDAADRSQQLSMYAMIRMAETGTLPASLRLDYLVRTPVKAERKHVQQETERSIEDVGAMVARLNTAVEAVKRGVFVPAPPDAWYCSAAYCEFFSTCPYTARGVRRPRS